MKYLTGEGVELNDRVTCVLGGIPFDGRVVAIMNDGQSVDDYRWLLEEEPRGIAIEWLKPSAAATVLCPAKP